MLRIGNARRYPDSYAEARHREALDRLLEDVREVVEPGDEPESPPMAAFPLRISRNALRSGGCACV